MWWEEVGVLVLGPGDPGDWWSRGWDRSTPSTLGCNVLRAGRGLAGSLGPAAVGRGAGRPTPGEGACRTGWEGSGEPEARLPSGLGTVRGIG